MDLELIRNQIEWVVNHTEFSDKKDCLEKVLKRIKSKKPLLEREVEECSVIATEMIKNYINNKN